MAQVGTKTRVNIGSARSGPQFSSKMGDFWQFLPRFSTVARVTGFGATRSKRSF